jgi:hypothetical protein
MAWNVYKMKDFCYSLSYAQEVMDFNLVARTEIYECRTGILGVIESSSLLDCEWKSYNPV